jgi:hypothetical protein
LVITFPRQALVAVNELRHERREPQVAGCNMLTSSVAENWRTCGQKPDHAVAEETCIWPIEAFRPQVANFGDTD